MADVADAQPTSTDATESLDDQIQNVKEQIRNAVSRRAALTSSLLSSEKLQSTRTTSLSDVLKKTLDNRVAKTRRDNLIASHRLALGVTRFTTRDPDPNAVDNREVTGIRIETYNPLTRKFDTPAYLFLNKPWASAGDDGTRQDKLRYRVHRHTFPPCIKLDALSTKYLPGPAAADSVKEARSQDLNGLVRALRRELTGLRRREEAVKSINKGLKTSDSRLKIQIVNAEATDLRILRSDGGIGRLRIDKNGNIGECFVSGPNGDRLRAFERQIKRAKSLPELGAALASPEANNDDD